MNIASRWSALEFDHKVSIAGLIATSIIGIASLIVAVIALILANSSADMKDAIAKLHELAMQSSVQTHQIGEQNSLMRETLRSQIAQTKSLALQSDATIRQVELFGSQLSVSKRQLSLSSSSLVQAIKQGNRAKSIPFEAALYETRVTALRSYAIAYYRFDNQLRLMTSDMPYDIYTSEGMELVTDSGMKETTAFAHSFLTMYANYVAEINSIMAYWPKNIQNQIAVAGDLGTAVSLCFIKLGEHARLLGHFSPEVYALNWQDVKEQSVGPCYHLNDRESQMRFQRASSQALSMMQAQLTKSQNDLIPARRN